MNDFEKKLKGMGLAGPSANLDQRVDETLGAAVQAPQTSRGPGRSWRLYAFVASGMAAALLLAVLASRHHRAKAAVYRIEARGSLRQLLLEPPSTAENQPRFTVNGGSP
jgi:hypothetical protein